MAQVKAEADKRILAAARRCQLLSAFFQQNSNPKMVQLQKEIIALRDRVSLIHLSHKEAPLLLLRAIENYLRSADVVIDVCREQFPAIAWVSDTDSMRRVQHNLSMLHSISLDRLNLSDRNLTHIPQEVASIQDLASLDISGNELTEVPSLLLKHRAQINAAHNHIRCVPPWVWQERYRTLDLRGNPLERPPYDPVLCQALLVHALFALAMVPLYFYFGLPWPFSLALGPVLLHALLSARDQYAELAHYWRFTS